jgi:glycerophosphoryl diester phosphodiesterase
MTSSPLILGHRGASAVAPENTLAAFSRAIDDGADGIEFDVRLSRDRIPVVIHDANLKRTGMVDKVVGHLTAAELQELDVGSWFLTGPKKRAVSTSYEGAKLPTLAQVFEYFQKNNGLLYVEMKCEPDDGPALAAEVVKLTRDSGMVERIVVESFDLAAVAAVKTFDANIRTAALFEPRISQPISTLRRRRMIDLARGTGAEEIALHHTLANPRTIELAKAQGLEVVVWTVDDSAWIRRARTLGIKALIANNPADMVTHRRLLA